MHRQVQARSALTVTRREFALMTAAAALPALQAEPAGLKVLIVVAHPDDEYAFAASVYRLARELGAVVDQVVISDGGGGYRYSALAEQVYSLPLTDERIARERLPEIRRRETLAAGKILGIRKHHFLHQRDGGYASDPACAEVEWDQAAVREFLLQLIRAERYQYVFTLLPTTDTHTHHRAATLLALDAVQSFPASERPVVLAAEAAASSEPHREYFALPGYPITAASAETYEFSRTRHFGFRNALSYTIVVNWVIAEHKSQGLFQTDVGKHDVERFWLLAQDNSRESHAARELFRALHSDSVQRSAYRQDTGTAHE